MAAAADCWDGVRNELQANLSGKIGVELLDNIEKVLKQ
jgi:hypothetical protein